MGLVDRSRAACVTARAGDVIALQRLAIDGLGGRQGRHLGRSGHGGGCLAGLGQQTTGGAYSRCGSRLGHRSCDRRRHWGFLLFYRSHNHRGFDFDRGNHWRGFHLGFNSFDLHFRLNGFHHGRRYWLNDSIALNLNLNSAEACATIGVST